jgi:hypothetical protein
MGDSDDVSRPAIPGSGSVHGRVPRRVLAEQLKEFLTVPARPLGDDLDAAVVQVGGRSGQAELQGARARPPPEPDALDTPANPHGEPHLAVRRHP